MTSSVYFKFKSQKEPSRVEFDGTGISVFELKREIIIKSGLGDGTDFDLAIYTEDGADEYDDDTTIIPRSTTVVARRLPAMRPGAGRAARYVTGKMPVTAKNASRREQVSKATAKATSDAFSNMAKALTEEEKMAAMFQAQSEQWTAQQEEMATFQPVYKPGSKKPVNVPDHEPPQGYVCYRCGEKGHWIQVCPTNDNPEYDNRPRVKRTTGIPKSFLKTVDKATALGQMGTDDESKLPSGVMVNADGEFVIAEPDKASWEKFQAKAKTSGNADGANAFSDKEIREQGLECDIDKKMFIEPMKTPCCQKTYCNECIVNALIESDFVCPGCSAEGILIDDLKPDEEMQEKIKEFLASKAAPKKAEEKDGTNNTALPTSPPATAEEGKAEALPVDTDATQQVSTEVKAEESGTPSDANPKPEGGVASPGDGKAASKSPEAKSPKSPTDTKPEPATDDKTAVSESDQQLSKKRPAEEPVENPRIPKGPKAMQNASNPPNAPANMMQQMMMGNPMNGMMGGQANMAMMNPFMQMPGMPPMPPFMNMPMNMNMPMMAPMMGQMGMGGFPMNNGFQPPMGNGNGNWNMGMGMGVGGSMNGMNNGGQMGGSNNSNNNNNNGNNGNGSNQQPPFRTNFTQQSGEDDAYMRKPVNPHRYQNRQRRARPSDYREL